MHDEVAPTVSVIVPIYNVESTLDQALSSIEAQTLRDIEIVCVNDGSTDRSPEIVKQHAKADPRVRLVNKPNGGYGSACNRGLDEARGKWIAILEPDDWIEPTMYEDMIAFVQEFNQPIDIVKTPYWRVIDPDTPREHLLNCSYKSRIKPKAQPFSLTDDGVEHLLIHHPSIWSALYRRTFLQESGIRFHEIPGAGWADNPFLVDTLCQARSIVYLDRAYYHYREETEGQTASFVEKNPMIPFERWHDMMDVLERLGIRDERVLLPLYRRAFTLSPLRLHRGSSGYRQKRRSARTVGTAHPASMESALSGNQGTASEARQSAPLCSFAHRRYVLQPGEHWRSRVGKARLRRR